MKQASNSRSTMYDLESRCFKFTLAVRDYIKPLPKSLTNKEFCRQLIRSAGSVGANYIEANEALSKKDFLFRVKIAKKDAKETRYWLLLTEPEEDGLRGQKYLVQEATEIMKMLGAVIEKSKHPI